MTLQEAFNHNDMMTGCINRMFITDEKEEFAIMYEGAKYYLDLIYQYNSDRLNDEE